MRRPDRTKGTLDHSTPTLPADPAGHVTYANEEAQAQVDTLRRNARRHAIELFDYDSGNRGIVHVIGPELGLTQPGMTIVCGDSHTATHGAFGALAFGIGTSEVEHVLATQTLAQRKPRSMVIRYEGELGFGVTAKDLILGTIGQMGTNGAAGHVVEFAGPVIEGLSMEGRMTVCNMTIEGGGRAGMIAPDETTFAWFEEHARPGAPKDLQAAFGRWRELRTDDGAGFDKEVVVDASALSPQVTWGTSPEDVLPITGKVPNPGDVADEGKRRAMERALDYMGLKPGTQLTDVAIDRVFIGSCTNGRIEDLREVAKIAKGRKVAAHVNAMVVPGSGLVKHQAEQEGLDKIFVEAGFEWREPGCSMCLAMNPDKLAPGERCASTSNRNFEGRQGRGGRTHLVSPAMAAAAAVTGHLTDVRKL